MNSNRTNRSWRLRQRPEGIIDENDLELVTDEIPEIQEGQVLAKTIYFSLDPTNRIWMSDIDQYMEPVEIGDIMRAGGSLAVVEESKVPHSKLTFKGLMEVARAFYNSIKRLRYLRRITPLTALSVLGF